VQAAAELGVRGAFAAVVGFRDGGHWWLLRDRLGRKSLYYYTGKDFLLFASELRALLASGLVNRRLNLTSIDLYLTFRCVPAPETLLLGVHRVRPGHVLHYDSMRTWQEPFARFAYEEGWKRDRDELTPMIRERLRTALARHRNGLLLWSSGLDCAALAALSEDAFQPVFVVLERSWQDEARLAKESAKRLRLPLRIVQARRFTEETFWQAARCLDEPIADASVFPLWLVFEGASHFGASAVTGHGADELLGGYPRYHLLQKAHGAEGLVPVNQLMGLLPALPPNAFVRRAGRYLATIRDPARAFLGLLSVFDQEEREELYTDAMRSAVYEQNESLGLVREHFLGPDLTRNLLSLDLAVTIPSLLLFACDHISAAHGMTVSCPYLDDDMVDLALMLAPRARFGVRSKPLLRLAMRGILPPRVRLRARRGFRIPQSGRVVRVIDSVTKEVITPERVDATGLFKWPYVEQTVESASHNVCRRRQFWALLMFFAWYREMMES